MFKKDTNTFRYFNSRRRMMLEKPETWMDQRDIGEGDALLRTSMSYMCYKEKDLKDGVLSCFRKVENKNSYYYQGSRCFEEIGEDNVSRDQTIIALSSLKYNNDVDDLKEIGLNLKFRLSKRYIMGPTMWIWIRMLCNTNIFYTYLFGILELIEFIPAILWNKFLRLILNLKDRTSDWYMKVDTTTGLWYNYDGDGWLFDEKSNTNNGYKLYNFLSMKKDKNVLYKIMRNLDYPTYALHLTSWMVYFMKDTAIKRFLQKLIQFEAEDSNLLLKLLSGIDVDNKTIDEYKPMWQFRWTIRFNGTCYERYLNGDDALYNVIDKDILISLKNKK